jgi:hypothetical protein
MAKKSGAAGHDAAARFRTTTGFREEQARARPWDGRASFDARGCYHDKVISRGEARTRDRVIADPYSGREFHVRTDVRVEHRPTRIVAKRPARFSRNGF